MNFLTLRNKRTATAMRATALACVVCYMLATTACFKAHADGGLMFRQQGMERDYLPAYDVIGSFNESKRAGWFLFALIPFRGAAGSSSDWARGVVEDEVQNRGGDAAINVEINSEWDILDVLIAIFIGGIYNTSKYTVSGDVIRFK